MQPSAAMQTFLPSQLGNILVKDGLETKRLSLNGLTLDVPKAQHRGMRPFENKAMHDHRVHFQTDRQTDRETERQTSREADAHMFEGRCTICHCMLAASCMLL